MLTRRRIKPLTVEQLEERVRREYAALPGLRLTEPQFRRLFGIDSAVSGDVLHRLIERRYLKMTVAGEYERGDLRRDVRAS